MKKEFFKTMLLYFLVITSLLLGMNIWSGKNFNISDLKTLTRDIKSAVSSDKSGFDSEGSQSSVYSDGIQWIFLSYNDTKKVLYAGEKDYNNSYLIFDKLKENLSKAGTVSQVSKTDFINAFKGKGIAVKFSGCIPVYDYFKEKKDLFENMKNPLCDVIFLTLNNDKSLTDYMYFSDYSTENGYRIPINYSNYDMNEFEKEISFFEDSNDSYSFELNFDKKNENMEKILIDGLVPVTTDEKSIAALKANVLSYFDYGNIYDSIFKSFNIKKNSARTYTDTEDVLNFIENKAVFKIYKDGNFVYEALNGYDGISLPYLDTEVGAVAFVNNLYQGSVGDDVYLSLKERSVENEIINYEFCYFTSSGPLYTKGSHSVIMKVKDKKIIYYKQLLLKFENVQSDVNVNSLITAYDNIYNSQLYTKKSDLTITNMYPVNVFYKNETYQKWYVEFSDKTYDFV